MRLSAFLWSLVDNCGAKENKGPFFLQNGSIFVSAYKLHKHMLRYAQAIIRMPSIPRMGRGAGRAGRRNNNARPYHASLTRSGPATAAALKSLIEPQFASSEIEIPATSEQRRHFSEQNFADAPISKASKSGIKHKYLSDVQAATLELISYDKDLLGATKREQKMILLLPQLSASRIILELPQEAPSHSLANARVGITGKNYCISTIWR